MKFLRLKDITKPYFHLKDLARAFDISLDSARVTASRYVKVGLLIRVKRDLYVLTDNWNVLTDEKKFLFANMLQSPSYVSLMTALSYYQISTQVQRDFIESVALKRTKTVHIKNTLFNFNKIQRPLFFGFVKKNNFFIAEPEKALLDAFYLMSLGRYTLDLASIDFSKFNSEKIAGFSNKFPVRVKNMVMQYDFV